MRRARFVSILLAVIVLGATAVREHALAARADTAAWTTAAPIPMARTGAAGVTGADGRIYVFGGADFSGRPFSDAEAYNATTNVWTPITPLPVANAFMNAVVAPNGKIYLVGGWDGHQSMSLVMAYDPTTNSYACSINASGCTSGSLAPLPTPRSNMGVTVGPDGWIYAFGGYTFQPVVTVEVYDPVQNLWHPATPLPHPAAGVSAATAPDGTMRVAGGFDGQSYLNAEYSVRRVPTPSAHGAKLRDQQSDEGAIVFLAFLTFDALLSGGWKEVEALEAELPNPLTLLVEFFAELFDFFTGGALTGGLRAQLAPAQASPPPSGILIAVGGSQGGAATSNVQVTNPMTGAWTQGVALPAGREDAIVAETNNTIFVIGGDDNVSSVFNTVFSLHLPPPPPPPMVTDVPTPTQVGAAATNTPTPTPIPPTATPLPTSTPVPPTPTNTPVPLFVSAKVGHKLVKTGTKQTIAVHTLPGASVSITIAYPNGKKAHHHATAGSSGTTSWSFKQANGLTRGAKRTAKVTITVVQGGVTLTVHKSYTIG